MAPKTIIAPYGTVTDVREAGGDALADGRKLKSGGVAWDLQLDDELEAKLEAAGAEIHERPDGEFLGDVVRSNGYALKEIKL
jgi:hypothetical protein